MIARILAVVLLCLLAGCGDDDPEVPSQPFTHPASASCEWQEQAPTADADAIATHTGEEQAVLVRFIVPESVFDLDAYFPLEDRLIDRLDESGVGEFDGNEVGPLLSDTSKIEYTIYTYGNDAEAVAAAVLPEVCEFATDAEVTITKRYGEPGAPETILTTSR
jgi:hypothetical protein